MCACILTICLTEPELGQGGSALVGIGSSRIAYLSLTRGHYHAHAILRMVDMPENHMIHDGCDPHEFKMMKEAPKFRVRLHDRHVRHPKSRQALHVGRSRLF